VKPSRLDEIRRKLGLTWEQFGAALGYGGNNPGTNASRFMKGERVIPRYLGRLALMYERFGIPKDINREDGV
jgi:transcriptional regulator with XRE-family HTH domain